MQLGFWFPAGQLEGHVKDQVAVFIGETTEKLAQALQKVRRLTIASPFPASEERPFGSEGISGGVSPS